MVKDHEAVSTPVGYLLLGAFVSFVVGLASLWWLVRWLERGRLQWFAAWCIPVGVIVIVWQLLA
jgi:undecaprenyl-diphosphatase